MSDGHDLYDKLSRAPSEEAEVALQIYLCMDHLESAAAAEPNADVEKALLNLRKKMHDNLEPVLLRGISESAKYHAGADKP